MPKRESKEIFEGIQEHFIHSIYLLLQAGVSKTVVRRMLNHCLEQAEAKQEDGRMDPVKILNELKILVNKSSGRFPPLER